MKNSLALCLFLLMFCNCVDAKTKTVKLHILETTDVHGSFFPYDFINRKPKGGSLARVYSYVDSLRSLHGENVLLLENGDLLQGQPTCYYYNYVATDKVNIGAQLTNFMKYDVQNFGNHDVETGHAVYDKWVKETHADVLGANIIDNSTSLPYLKPYSIFNRDGVKIAVLGMLTPAIPSWLGENLWSGLHFEELLTSTRKWMKIIKEQEHPDIIVGLYHSGRDGGIVTPEYEENAAERIAREVPGFDVIFYGHDHIRFGGKIESCDGSQTWILDPSNNALNVAEACFTLTLKGGKVKTKEVEGKIVDITKQPVNETFMKTFETQIEEVNTFVNRVVGTFTNTIYTRDSFFGSSPFSDFIHNIQLRLTGADVSFNAPLAFNAEIKAGELHVSDMFNLYKYENMLCVLMMSGEEIRRHLEMSYGLWVNTIQSADDHIMLLNEANAEDSHRSGFKNPTFNFDSAAGIDYEVDVTKPLGERVRILRMSNGQPFDPEKTYKVAMNSYRANGGGELLTRGAGIPHEDIKQRIVWQSDKDLRYYLMQEIEREKVITPAANNNWRFVPEELTVPTIAKDKKLLFKL